MFPATTRRQPAEKAPLWQSNPRTHIMAIKKSDLYSSLWASCDELRGGMDASQYKDYVLFMVEGMKLRQCWRGRGCETLRSEE